MNIDLSLWSVFIAGLLSFLSPCVLPLVPPYLCYMSGLSIADLKSNIEAKSNCKKLTLNAISFIIGFTTIFVLLGTTASWLGIILNKYRYIFMFASGLVIILMGLNFLRIFNLSSFNKEIRFHSFDSKGNLFKSYVMGLAFAFGWTPCIGPILGAVLSIASQRDSLYDGAKLLTIYSLGLAIPFLLAAFFSECFMIFLNKFKVHLGIIEKIIGILLIIIGLLFLSGQLELISNLLISSFPNLSNF